MARSSRIFTCIFFLSLMLLPSLVRAQTLTQTVRGKVTDQDSRMPLPGVNVVIVGPQPFLGGSSNEQGQFRIENVPVGRITVKISYLGYGERLLSNLLVTSGKETVLEVELQESLIGMDEVVVRADQDKSRITNEMALVSARGFTVEETKRYAGSFNDPARMVSGYAGVTGDASGDNVIIVREIPQKDPVEARRNRYSQPQPLFRRGRNRRPDQRLEQHYACRLRILYRCLCARVWQCALRGI